MESEKQKEEKSFNKISSNSSTLSLHISAYENSIEGVSSSATNNDDENVAAPKKKKSNKEGGGLIKNLNESSSSAAIQSLFEFPRQQEETKNDESIKPEVMQFKASQKLLNPKHTNISMNRTLAIIKPDAVSHPVILRMVGGIIINAGFNISRACRIQLTENQAKELYSVHVAKFFYDRLIAFMTSGPVLAMELQSSSDNKQEDVITKWRNSLGPSKLYANFMKYSSIPDNSKPLRICFALSDTRNLAHGSDSPQEFLREIAVFEPFMKTVNNPYKLFELPNELKAISD